MSATTNTLPLPVNRLRAWSSSAAVGFAFGFALEKAKVYLPSVIIDQMRFKSFIMVEMFLTATLGGAVVIHLLRSAKIVDVAIRPPISLGLGYLRGYGRNALGGLVLGVGMGIAGACPGTVLVQAATGVRYSSFVLSGAFCGSLIWPYLNDFLARKLPDYGKKSPTSSLPKSLGLTNDSTTTTSFFVLAFASTLAAAVAIAAKTASWPAQLQRAYTARLSTSPNNVTVPTIFLDHPSATRADLSAFAWHPIVGGLAVTLAQSMSLLLLSTPLGASTSYAVLASTLLKHLDPSWRVRASACANVPTLTTNSDWHDATTKLLNSAGVVAGAYASALLGGALDAAHLATAPRSRVLGDDAVRAFVGGVLLLFGARVAEGCTSGHGISGVASLSTASAITVAAMFAGAIGAANIIY